MFKVHYVKSKMNMSYSNITIKKMYKKIVEAVNNNENADLYVQVLIRKDKLIPFVLTPWPASRRSRPR